MTNISEGVFIRYKGGKYKSGSMGVFSRNGKFNGSVMANHKATVETFKLLRLLPTITELEFTLFYRLTRTAILYNGCLA